jgi:hypothetical protein
MQMRKQVRLGSRHFSDDKVFVGKVSDVAPHGQILDKHFEEIIVMDRALELLKIFR